MAIGIRRARRDATLRPVRWSVRPRGGTAPRIALVAALLALATGVLYSRDSPAGPCAGPVPPAATPGSAIPSRSAGSIDGAGMPAPPAGLVGVPVRIGEPATLGVVRPGGRVDLLAVPASAGLGRPAEPTLVAAAALVLGVIGAATTDGAAGLYLALPPEQARRAVGLPDNARFAIIVRP